MFWVVNVCPERTSLGLRFHAITALARAPRLGEDTEAVLKRAGVKAETIADLRAKGVI